MSHTHVSPHMSHSHFSQGSHRHELPNFTSSSTSSSRTPSAAGVRYCVACPTRSSGSFASPPSPSARSTRPRAERASTPIGSSSRKSPRRFRILLDPRSPTSSWTRQRATATRRPPTLSGQASLTGHLSHILSHPIFAHSSNAPVVTMQMHRRRPHPHLPARRHVLKSRWLALPRARHATDGRRRHAQLR